MNLLLTCLLSMRLAAQSPAQDVDKSVAVVPREGPLKGQSVYTGTYSLFVGIGSYQNPAIPRIACAPNDAKSMRDLLVGKYGFDPSPDRTVVLANGEATKTRIEHEIARLCDSRRVKATDRVLVYFSCHGQGVPAPNGEKVGYLVPYDASVQLGDLNNASQYQESCLDMGDLTNRLKFCPARHRTLIVDACFSGFAAGAKALTGTTYSPGALTNMLGQPGLVVMTAGDSEDQAEGSGSETGLSLFTRALEDSLNEATINGGTFTAEQLAAEASARTLAAGRQKPQYGQKDGSGQMLFFAATTGASPTAIGGPATPAPVAAPISHAADSPLTITVSESSGMTLAKAAAEAKPGSTIILEPGTYRDGVTFTVPVTIKGDGPKDSVVIDPPESTGGTSLVRGGSITGVTLRGCLNLVGKAKISNCVVSSDVLLLHELQLLGGPTYSSSQGSLTMAGCTVTGKVYGGRDDTCVFSATDCDFAARVECTCETTVNKSTFHDGAVLSVGDQFNKVSLLKVSGCEFSKLADGYAFVALYGVRDALFEDCSFDGFNKNADKFTAAVFLDGGAVARVVRCKFTENRGHEIRLVGGSKVTLVDTKAHIFDEGN